MKRRVCSGGRAAVAAELRAGGDGRVAVLAGFGFERLAAVVAELRAGLHLRLTVRAGLRRGLLLHVRAAVVAELRAGGRGRAALRARNHLSRRAALLASALLTLLLALSAAEGVRHHLPHAEAHA